MESMGQETDNLNMFFGLLTGGNAVFIIIRGVLVVLVVIIFAIIYAADFKDTGRSP